MIKGSRRNKYKLSGRADKSSVMTLLVRSVVYPVRKIGASEALLTVRPQHLLLYLAEVYDGLSQ